MKLDNISPTSNNTQSGTHIAIAFVLKAVVILFKVRVFIVKVVLVLAICESVERRHVVRPTTRRSVWDGRPYRYLQRGICLLQREPGGRQRHRPQHS